MGAATEALFRTWDHEHGSSARVIRAIPEGKAGYRPHERSRTAGELAWHLAEAERWFVVGALGLEVPGEDPVPKESPPPSAEAMADAFDRSHAGLVAAVRARDEAWLDGVVEFYGMRLPRRAVLDLLIRHEVHHRGQLTVYLRLAGGRVPGVYGPSADDAGD